MRIQTVLNSLERIQGWLEDGEIRKAEEELEEMIIQFKIALENY